MEWLASILTSSNAIPIIIIVVLLVVIIAILAKKGIISFKGKGLTVGNGNDERDIERTIIRNQIQNADLPKCTSNYLEEVEKIIQKKT